MMNATGSFSPSTNSISPPLATPDEALRPSVAATACGLLAMALLILTSGPLGWALPFCALALMATHFNRWRWQRTSMTPAIVRLILFTALLLTADFRRLDIDWIFRESTLQFIGQLAAVELVLQHWRSVRGVRYPAISLLLSCAIFLAACNVRLGIVPTIIPLVTPVFWVCLLWALRDWSGAINPVAGQWKLLLSSRFGLLTVGFLLLALCGGALLHRLSIQYRETLMGLGSNVLRQNSASMGGISMRPRLSSIFEARLSTERVLKIEGSLPDAHLRAASFETYRLGAWSPPLSSRALDTWTERQLGSSRSGPRTRIVRLLDLQNNTLFAPLNSRGIIPGPPNGIEEVLVQGNAKSGTLLCDENAPWSYQIISNQQNFSERNLPGVATFQGPLCAPLTDSSRADFLQVPDNLGDEVTKIALTAAGDAKTPAEKIQNIENYLLVNHKYSFTFAIETNEADPLTQFLVKKGAAHCEFFAAAMTILARINGVPARYVVGYLAHEAELGSGGAVTVVRQRDSHAWSEVWFDGVGWITVDATPDGGLPDELPNIGAMQRASEWARDALENIRQRALKIPKRTWFFIVTVPLGLWFLIRVQPFRRVRTGAKKRAGDYASPDEQLAQLSPRFERWLSRQGAHVAPTLSWQRSFNRHETLPADRPDAALWLHDYERARFGADWEITENLEARLREIETTQSPKDKFSASQRNA